MTEDASYTDTLFRQLVNEGALEPGDGLVGVCYVAVFSLQSAVFLDGDHADTFQLSCWVDGGDCFFVNEGSVEAPQIAFERGCREMAVASDELLRSEPVLVETSPLDGVDVGGYTDSDRSNFYFHSGRILSGDPIPKR